MELLRNIEKNVISIVNANNNTMNLDNLNKNIKLYFEYIANKDSINNQKRDIYIKKYENVRIAQNIEYDNYLREKQDLKEQLAIEKTKTALHNYLKLKQPAYNDKINVHTYQNINLTKRPDKIPAPINQGKIAKPANTAKPTNPANPAKPKICKEGKEVNPVTGNCVNKCKEGELRDTETGKCKKIKKVVPKQEPKQEPKEEPKQEPEQEPEQKPKEEPKQEPKQDKCTEAKKRECEEKGKKCNPDSGRCIKK